MVSIYGFENSRNSCPLSQKARALVYQVKFFCTMLGKALDTSVILCMWILFWFYENTFPCVCLEKPLRKQHSEKTALRKNRTQQQFRRCVFSRGNLKTMHKHTTLCNVYWDMLGVNP